ncbi:MAG: CDP-2,3-bis-(O-geranylgeranyl)-sn-glycerol synthase [Methanofollis sp.]|nr:CDP-2,3-bis-(O-geranylgeranyl)-sn-glycerol synthase [Methanofollis sp.]
MMMPAYVPNPTAAAFGGGTPVDLGKNWRDGRRVLGDGKTFRGFFIGIAAGIVVGLLQIRLQDVAGFAFLPEHTVVSVVLFSVGALLGDMAKSFFKRRLGMDRGEEWLIFDQYDLVIGAFVLTAVFQFGWLVENLTLMIFIWIIILTPLLHRAANIIGYFAGVKDVPW